MSANCIKKWDERLQQFAYALTTAVQDNTEKYPASGGKTPIPFEKLLFAEEQLSEREKHI